MPDGATAEARDIDAVLGRIPARIIGHRFPGPGAQAQNRCIELIALAEKKIGLELVKGQETGELLKPNERPNSTGADRHRYLKATIAELGLTKQQNRDFREMAAVPPARPGLLDAARCPSSASSA